MTRGFHVVDNSGKQVTGKSTFYSPIPGSLDNKYPGRFKWSSTEELARDFVSSVILKFGSRAVVSKEELWEKLAAPSGMTVEEFEGILNYSIHCRFPMLERARIVSKKKAGGPYLSYRKKTTEQAKRKVGRPRTGKALPKFGLEGLVG